MAHPEITQYIKAPPIAPLIPYFPKLFGMESFFPPFYFTYFVIALAVVAIFHEFSHGIFMRLFRVRIKSTGLVFLGPILGAFVEEEKGQFEKKSNLQQMTILGAGVFANLLLALLFYGLYVGFFFASFSASGYIFNSYSRSAIPVGNITSFNEVGNLTEIVVGNKSYFLDKSLASQLVQDNVSYIVAYEDTPAFKTQMKGAIVEANGVAIKNQDDLQKFMIDKEPGDEILFVTESPDKIEEYNLILGKHPSNNSRGYIGIGSSVNQGGGLIQRTLSGFMKFKEPSTYYKPTWDGNFVYFIYHLLWWVMIINLLVALFNMLPIGMLDGGRFFYLGILSISRSKRFAKATSKLMAYVILFAFLALMFFWFIRII